MKIIFFGTPKFAVPSLEKLAYTKNIEILAVFTQPDKPAGRKKIMTQSPVKELAKKLNLKIFQPENKKKLVEMLQNLERPDFFVVIAYGMIMPKEALKIPRITPINVHISLLPKYRGPSPIQEALLNSDKETGISIMEMNEKIDEGNIYLIRRVQIEDTDNQISLSEKIAKLSGDILPHVLQDIANGILSTLPQTKTQKPTYCRKIKKEDGKIDWNCSAEEIKNQIRAYTPWPSAYTNFHGKNLKILKADVGAETESKRKISPGQFLFEEKKLKIGTKKGILIPKIVQLEGKKEMDIKQFINGYKNVS